LLRAIKTAGMKFYHRGNEEERTAEQKSCAEGRDLKKVDPCHLASKEGGRKKGISQELRQSPMCQRSTGTKNKMGVVVETSASWSKKEGKRLDVCKSRLRTQAQGQN